MSNSDALPKFEPNGSPPESGSFLGLSRSGSSPAEKPKGRSAMPSTVLTGCRSCAWAGHAESEPYIGRREQADFYAAGRLGADRGVRGVAVVGDGALCVARTRPDVRHTR